MISIIVPVYNAERYLRQCIESILEQTYKDFELILIDDGSNDGSYNICKEYESVDDRIRLIHENNKGSAEARNVGLKQAKGDYLMFLDADDWIDRDHIGNLVNLAKVKDATIVISSYYCFNGRNVYVENMPHNTEPKDIICDSLNGRVHAGLWNKLFKRDLFTTNNIRFPKYGYYEDMCVFISCLCHTEKNKIVLTKYATYHYRINPSSQTFNTDINKKLKSFTEMMANFSDIWEKYPLLNEERIRNAFLKTINANKFNLYYEFYIYSRTLHNFFIKYGCTYKFKNVKGLRGLAFYLTDKFGYGWPYFLLKCKINLGHIFHKIVRR